MRRVVLNFSRKRRTVTSTVRTSPNNRIPIPFEVNVHVSSLDRYVSLSSEEVQTRGELIQFPRLV